MASPTMTVRRADLFFAEKDQALREDVHRLGGLVGELVREQAGEAVFDLVESARRAAIDYREGDVQAVEALSALLATLAPSTAQDFIRAFSTYFQMVNMAEKVHRIRRRRAYSRDVTTPQPFGFADILQRLRAAGADADAVERAMGELLVEPVFTTSSTQATRRTLLRKQQNIARHLVEMLDPYMTPQELEATLGRIRLEMTTGWQTEEHPAERLRAGDEAEHVLFFLTEILYRVIPPFYEALEEALIRTYPERGSRIRPPIVVRFSSWVGGDLDSNPNVTAKSIRETLSRHRALALDLYFNECRDLARQLSQSESRIGVADEIHRRCGLYSGHFSKALHAVPGRHRTMPYRVFLRLITARLQATYDDAAFPYESPDEFIADIELIADSLRANKGRNAGLFTVQRLLRRAHTFGFHIAALDIRQSSHVHRRVVGEGLRDAAWRELSSEARAARILEALERRESPPTTLSSEARRTLAVFQTIAHSRRKYGPASIGPYVVSMAEGVDDVLSVLLLAKWGHLGAKGSEVPLDIVPAFETEEQLARAPELMGRLLGEERYRRHLLAQRDQAQMVMVGYSEANRDGGPAASRWMLHETQRALIAVAREAGVKLKLFHGRGGTVSRSQGRPYEAVLAAPAGAMAGQLRMIEQGEMINAKYGLRGIAIRSLEQVASSLLAVTTNPPPPHAQEPRWHEIMGAIAARSRQQYRRLVQESPDFMDYFAQATPVDVVERLGAMERAAYGPEEIEQRKSSKRPWDFAWTQSRCLLPEWFGVAAGLAHGVECYGEPALKEMFEQWYFFRVLLIDIEAVLAKVDLDIAERYSQLAGSLHGRFFPTIRTEYDRCVDLVLRVSGQKKLLESSETLRRAIRLRNPYVDPMSLLQIDLLRRWRAGERKDDAMLNALFASVNGIAYGMQNTG